MYLVAISDKELSIKLDSLENGEKLKTLLRRFKKNTIKAKNEGSLVLFSSGPKIFRIRVERPVADKEYLAKMISKIPNEIKYITTNNAGATIAFK